MYESTMQTRAVFQRGKRLDLWACTFVLLVDLLINEVDIPSRHLEFLGRMLFWILLKLSFACQ